MYDSDDDFVLCKNCGEPTDVLDVSEVVLQTSKKVIVCKDCKSWIRDNEEYNEIAIPVKMVEISSPHKMVIKETNGMRRIRLEEEQEMQEYNEIAIPVKMVEILSPRKMIIKETNGMRRIRLEEEQEMHGLQNEEKILQEEEKINKKRIFTEKWMQELVGTSSRFTQMLTQIKEENIQMKIDIFKKPTRAPPPPPI
jgi:hypothetical protein